MNRFEMSKAVRTQNAASRLAPCVCQWYSVSSFLAEADATSESESEPESAVQPEEMGAEARKHEQGERKRGKTEEWMRRRNENRKEAGSSTSGRKDEGQEKKRERAESPSHPSTAERKVVKRVRGQ